MKLLLLRIADWIYRHYGLAPIVVEEQVLQLLPTARAVADKVRSRFPEAGFGDARRRDALALMMKRCPEASKRDIGLAIELAVRSR